MVMDCKVGPSVQVQVQAMGLKNNLVMMVQTKYHSERTYEVEGSILKMDHLCTLLDNCIWGCG